jgi:CDP-diacylglycerol--glycerol-3-phosphate 3-phosphatidyltransferase
VSTYAIKPAFQALLRPIARELAGAGVTANEVTIATTAVSVIVGALAAWRLPDTRAFLLLPVWLFLRMACNAIDGLMAREHGQRSALGTYLNELGDVISDVALYLPFAILQPFSAVWTGAVVMLAVMTEYAGALGPLAGSPRRYDGPMGKSDRALVFGALGFIAGLMSLPAWVAFVMPAMAVTLVATLINRIRAGVRNSALGD